MTIAWVIGSGGLLGSALCSALHRDGTEVFFPMDRLRWSNYTELAAQLEASVRELASRVGSTDRWEVYWAAGVGSMGSTEDSLAPETRAMSLVLELLESNLQLMATSGAVAFASSAGAIYAGSRDDIITEDTTPKPTTAYAREKLKQEDLVRSFAVVNNRITTLIARFSTLYGNGQTTNKQQGLITHIARSILRNQPIQIYVPYDTVRDYIASDDAAYAMITTLRAINRKDRIVTKIIASEHPTTIAEIISIFKRILRGRGPRIITSASRLSCLYSRRMQFRSIVLPTYAEAPKKSLLIGISQLMMAERNAWGQSIETSSNSPD